MVAPNEKVTPTGTNLGSDVDALTKLIGLFTGQKSDVTASGGTQTQQTMLSQEALNTLMRQAMESTQGLAAVSSGQKAPGLYNSTTRQLLTNDLMARTAGEVATKGAPTVTTTTPKTQSTRVPSPLGSAGGLLAGAGLLLSSPSAKAMGKKALAKLLGGDGDVPSSITQGDISAILSRGDSGISSMQEGLLSDMGASNEALLSAAGYGSAGAGAATGLSSLGDFSSPLAGIDWTQGTQSIYDSLAQMDWGTEAAQYLGATDGFSAYDSATAFSGATDAAGAAIPGVGQIMRAASGDVEGAAGSYTVSQIPVVGPYIAAIDAITGAGVGNFVGEAPSEIIQAGGDFLSDVGNIFSDCFLTTATCRNRNLPDDCFELTALRQFRDEFVAVNHPEQVTAYYALAPKIVAGIDSREDASALWDEIYTTYIVPCAQLAAVRRYETAHSIYTRMIGVVAALAGIAPEGSSNE